MRKIVLVTGILSTLLLADVCSEAERLFSDSRDESSLQSRIALIKQAKNVCDIPQIAIEMEHLKIEHLLSKNQLDGVESRLHELMSDTDTKDGLPYSFRFNTKREVMKLFKILYTKQQSMVGKKSAFGATVKNLDAKLANLDKKLSNDLKSLEDVGGLYHSNLKFLKNSSEINDLMEANELKEKMEEIIASTPNALFAVTGYASSEGSKSYNKALSERRAKGFVAFVGKYKQNIKTFSKGEAFLVCYDKLIPEVDENGENRCINGEDKQASRRVEVRRVR